MKSGVRPGWRALRSQFAISKRPCDLVAVTAGVLIVAF
jgi:hypothetical protein